QEPQSLTFSIFSWPFSFPLCSLVTRRWNNVYMNQLVIPLLILHKQSIVALLVYGQTIPCHLLGARLELPEQQPSIRPGHAPLPFGPEHGNVERVSMQRVQFIRSHAVNIDGQIAQRNNNCLAGC